MIPLSELKQGKYPAYALYELWRQGKIDVIDLHHGVNGRKREIQRMLDYQRDPERKGPPIHFVESLEFEIERLDKLLQAALADDAA